MKIFALLFSLLLAALAVGHDGPDPVASWDFSERFLSGGVLKAKIGPDASVQGNPTAVREVMGQSLRLDGRADRFVVAPDYRTFLPRLPKRNLTAEAWFSVDEPQGYGGIIGILQDNGGQEKGWVLGYNDRTFTFGLSSQGADDGDGKMTYLAAKTRYEAGRMYHVVGTYDGREMRIYVNGKLETTSTAQSGDLLMPEAAPWTLAGYRDADEDIPLKGRVAAISLYDLCATAEGVAHLFEHRAALAQAAPILMENPNFELLVQPYLQYVTTDAITVMWETTRDSSSVVYVGPDEKSLKPVEGDRALIHRVRLTGLKPNAHYLYRVESVDGQGRKLESEISTFRTAPLADQPIRFAVVGDTQDQPAVNHRIAEGIWGERPDFLLIPGDLVGTGANKTHWTEHFFGSMRPLLSRVTLFPVLGNHEGDARLYYDYMSVPEPKYYYSFRYGPAEVFVVDSNREVGPGSEQWKWLDRALRESKAKWKFVTHHHPPFSSDEDDYGNLWKGQSTWGDERIRALAELYEKHRVDVVWTGHIHSYERTWPIRRGEAAATGPIYIICGGGGGGLETPAPTRPAFSNNVRRGHHYCIVALHGNRFEMRVFDIEGRLFDVLTLVKD